MSAFYKLEFRFCNARRGNEKGTVEETVKVLRKEAFSVRDHFDSQEEAQAYLDEACERLNGTGWGKAAAEVVRLAEEDFAAMRPCTDYLGCFQLVERKVNNYGVITMEKAFCSVPDRLTLKTVMVRDYTNKVEVLEERAVVAVHEKVPAGEWRLTPMLMSAALAPEKSCTLAATVMLQQDGGAIERRAGEGLRMAAQLMMTTVKATNYGAAE